jgi:hypothetical protein
VREGPIRQWPTRTVGLVPRQHTNSGLSANGFMPSSRFDERASHAGGQDVRDPQPVFRIYFFD